MMKVDDLRDTNEARLLHIVRSLQPVSRAEIVKASGVRAGTVSAVMNRLLSGGYVSEGKLAPSSGGRPAMYLQVNAERFFGVGVNIGAQQSDYVISDFNGRVLNERSIRTQLDAEPFLRKFARELKAVLRSNHPNITIEAVGVSVPGMLDRVEGRLVISPNLGWKDVPLRELLEKELGIPVYVENDANAAALSEIWYGPVDSSPVQDLLFVLVVEGIGTGVIINGSLYFGTTIGLGGFGHVPMDPNGPQCSCGNIGCWEALASDVATLARFFKKHPEEVGRVHTVSELASMAQNGHDGARHALIETAIALGRGIRGLAQGLAPELIVVGGQVTAAWNIIEPIIQDEVHSGYLISGYSRPQIRPASAQRPSLFGAIPIAFRDVFNRRSPGCAPGGTAKGHLRQAHKKLRTL